MFGIGVFFIFMSDIFCHSLVGVILVETVGARLYVDIVNSENVIDVPKPSETFYSNAYITAIYGLPFLIVGFYLIYKFKKTKPLLKFFTFEVI